MLLPDWAVLDVMVDWLSTGLLDLTWWQIVLYALVTTHITIASVTIYLHRHQAHRAMDLHAIPAHFFRFWLWLATACLSCPVGGGGPASQRTASGAPVAGHRSRRC